MEGKTELAFSSQRGWGARGRGAGGIAGAEKAELGWLPAALSLTGNPPGPAETSSWGDGFKQGPGSPALSLPPTPPPGGAVGVRAEGTPRLVGV